MLKNFVEKKLSLLLEVTQRTKSEGNFTGGVPVVYRNKQHILELSQVPFEIRQSQFSILNYKYFNTDNIWINLNSLSQIQNVEIDFALKGRVFILKNFLSFFKKTQSTYF